ATMRIKRAAAILRIIEFLYISVGPALRSRLLNGSRRDPIIVEILWRVVAEQGNMASSGLLGYIVHPCSGSDQQVLSGRNIPCLIARDHLVPVKSQAVLDFTRCSEDRYWQPVGFQAREFDG